MFNEDLTTVSMKKDIGNYVLDGFDMEIEEYDENGCPLVINFYRLKEGYYEETIELHITEGYADHYGFDKIYQRVVYDYRYSYTEGRVLKDR